MTVLAAVLDRGSGPPISSSFYGQEISSVIRLETYTTQFATSCTENSHRPSQQLKLWPEPEPNRIDTLRFPIRLAGELFFCEIDNEEFVIRHEKWSLIGVGASMLEAELSLYEEAKSVAEILLQKPFESLDQQAVGLCEFLRKIF